MKQILSDLIAGEPAQPEQVSEVVDRLMSGSLDPALAGAFLSLQMRNGISAPQLSAALEVLMRYAETLALEDLNAVDNCGTGGDGGGSFNVSTTAAFVIAGAGHTVAKHGNRAVSSTCGSADLLESLGIGLHMKAERVRRCIDDIGIGFMFAPLFHPAMRHAGPIRKALGVRTMFNMLGPLANPARVRCQLIGVFEEKLTEIFGEVLARLGRTAYVVYGEDGSDEVSLTTRTKITEVRDGSFRSYIFDPRGHGFNLVDPDQIPGGTLAKNRAIFESVLKHAAAGPALEMTVLNAGIAMHTTGAYQDLDKAFQTARDSVVSGKAWAKVEALVGWKVKP